MIQLSSVTKSFGARVLLDDVTWQVSDRETRRALRAERRRQDDAAPHLRGPRRAGRRGGDQAVRPARGLPAAGRPDARRAHAARRSGARLRVAAGRAQRRCRRSRSASADPAVPEGEHEAMLHRYSDLQDRFRLHDGYAIDLKIDTVLRGLGLQPRRLRQADGDVLGRLADAHRAGEAAARRSPTCCCSTSRPTTSISTRATGSRSTCTTTRTRSSSSRTIASSSTPSSIASPTSTCARSSTTPCNYSTVPRRSATSASSACATPSGGRTRKWRASRCSSTGSATTATKAAQVQSRIKMLEKVVPIEVPPERKRVHFTFPTCEKSGRMVFELKGVRKAYGDDARLRRHRPATSSAATASRCVGPNGAGKSTLMRMLSGVEEPDAGTRDVRPPGRDAVLRAGRGGAPRPGRSRSTRRCRRARRSTWSR